MKKTYDPLRDGISSVQYIDHMGSDLSVVDAARASFKKESAWADPVTFGDYSLQAKDAKLVKYLADHKHFMPFCHPHLSIRVTCPLFVARQLSKSQVGLSISEESRRYVDGTPEVYIPKSMRMRPDGSIKQGSSEETTTGYNERVRRSLRAAVALYDDMVDSGIAPEDARMVLPQAMYTTFVWTGSLQAWLRVIELRADSHTQHQTREFAYAIQGIVKYLWPVSYSAHFGEENV
jgi:thymidylate synthase (FAD)